MTDRLSDIFHAAVAVTGPERERLLAEACGDDVALRREVDSLLAHASAADHGFDLPALQRAGRVFGDGGSLIGRRLGVYEIRAAIGAGGMGEVYRAHDTRLKRDVAIKVLPAEWAGDADRRARFQREAELLATLNHPNIAAIYGIEDADRISALVLELVDGPTLADRIARGPIPIGEALAIARQIGDALDAAHERRIVHRDLKPANIKVRPDGTVKVLDFGLAKAVALDEMPATDAPTLAVGGTRTGVVLGTPAYMSPEQARGQALDKRTDIWSFGCVLYEMLTGHAPFAGNTAADMVAGILGRSPDWDALPATTPPHVRRLLLRTLEKDPARRLRDVGEAKIAIDARDPDDAIAGGRPKRRSLWSWPTLAAVGATLLVLVGGGTQLLRTKFPGGTSGGRIRSVAVLPFANVNGGPDMEYLSDGLTEGIIDRLARLPDLKVISHAAAARYRGQGEDLRTVGRDLGVEAVLTGRIQSRDESLIVTLELVDGRDNRHIESFRYDRRLSDLPALQQEIPVDVSEKFRLRSSDDARQRLTKQSTASAEAYDLYLKGRFAYERDAGKEGAQTAVNYFRQAIDRDPDYALAYAGLADAVVNTGLQDAHRTARDAAATAMALDPTIGESHASLAKVLLFQDWKFEEAGQALKRAIDRSPSSIQAHHLYSHYLLTIGQIDESLVESQTIVKLDPVTPLGDGHLGYHYLYTRQYDKAIEHLVNDPTSPNELGDAYYAKGMFREAVDQYLKARALVECTPEEIAPLRDAFDREGIKGFLRKRIEQAVAGPGRLKVGSDFAGAATMFGVARTYARLGEKDHVFEWLEKAYAEHSDYLVLLRQEIDFDPVRTDPRFASLLRRIGLPPV